MSYDLGTAHGKIDLDYDGGRAATEADADIDKVGRTSDRSDKSVKKFGDSLDKFSAFMGKVGKSALIGAAGISTLVNAVHFLSATLAALGPIAAAGLATLPGLALGAATAIGLLKIATAGVGDALKAISGPAEKFDKALEKLSPNARAFAVALRGVAESFKPTQQAIQDGLFEGLAGSVASAAKKLMVLRGEAVQAASAFGNIAKELINFAGSATSIFAIRSSLIGVNDVLRGIAPGIKPLLTGFAQLAGQAGQFGDVVGGKVADAMTRFGNFLGGINLEELFQKAGPILSNILDLFKNIGTVVSTVFSALGSNGADALGVLGEITSKLAEFLNTAEGQQALQALGQAMGAISGSFGQVFLELLKQLAPTIVALAPGLAKLAQQLADVLVPALQAAGPLLEKLAKFLSDNMDTVGPIVIAIGGLAVAVKAYGAAQKIANAAMLIWNGLAKALPALTKAWAAAQWLLNVALDANPIGLIIIAVAALIAAIVLIATKTDWFQRLWKTVWGAIKTAAGAVADWFTGTIVPSLKTAWDAVAGFFSGAWDIIKGVLNFFADGFKAFWSVIKGVLDFFAPAFQAAFKLISSVISTAWTIISAIFEVWKTVMGAVFKPVLDFLVGFFTWAFGVLSKTVSNAWGFIKSVSETVWNAISGFLSSVWKGITDTATRAWEFLKGVIFAAWEAIKPYVTVAVEAVTKVIKAAWDVITTVTSTVWKAIKETFTSTWDSIKAVVSAGVERVTAIMDGIRAIVDKVKKFFNDLKNAASGGTGSLIDFVKGIPGKVIGAIGNLGKLLYDKGRELVRGFINGIGSMVNAAVDKVKQLVGAVMDYLPGSPAKKGPLSGKGWTPYRGAALVEGLSEGMTGAIAKLQRVSLQVATIAAPVLPTAVAGANVPSAASLAVPTINVTPAESGGGVVINSLNVTLQGIWDMTDPQATRKIAAGIFTAVENLKKEYR